MTAKVQAIIATLELDNLTSEELWELRNYAGSKHIDTKQEETEAALWQSITAEIDKNETDADRELEMRSDAEEEKMGYDEEDDYFY